MIVHGDYHMLKRKQPDYIHALLDHPPIHSLSTIAGRLKGASSHAVRKLAYAEVRQRLWGRHFWSPSYFVVSCGGASLKTIKRYIETQESPLSRP